jgi:hypothetical protein
MTEPFDVPEEAVYPLPESRYRIYARRGEEREILAHAPDPAGLGVALVQLDEDERERGRRLVDLGAIGILDALEHRWLIMPWHRRDPALLRLADRPLPETVIDRHQLELLARFHEAGWRITPDGDPYRPDEVPEGR